MTDARMPETYLLDRRINRLTDSEFRAFVTATIWAVANRTDGIITPEDLPLIPRFAESATKALVDANLWNTVDEGWLIADFELTQTTREQLAASEQARVKARDKKRQQRAAVPPSVPRDVPGDNIGQDRTGVLNTSPVLSTKTLKRATTQKMRGSRIPDDFTVTEAMVAWARERTPLVDGPRATEKFINHWTAATRNATKLDWPATWRNWMLREQEFAERSPGRKQTPEERMRATLALVPDLKELTS